uniref:Secreted protein n=1 Tax=Globodera pallida TaxID=36090 RepID=A0A183BRA3_GLOPA
MVDKSHAPFIAVLLTLVTALLIFIAISRPSVHVQDESVTKDAAAIGEVSPQPQNGSTTFMKAIRRIGTTN